MEHHVEHEMNMGEGEKYLGFRSPRQTLNLCLNIKGLGTSR